MRTNGLTCGRFCLAIACVLVLAAPAAAQFDRGTISGIVKDQSGAIVPGVTVTAKSLQTQELATAVTDATGYYTMTTLRPGQYEVSAELDGFKKTNRSGVALDGGATIRVEFVLEAGNLLETVTVVPRPRRFRPTSRSGRRLRPRTSSCSPSRAATRSACRR